MTKRDERPPLGPVALRIAAAVRGLMAEQGQTQNDMRTVVADHNGPRSQSYVSERVSGVSGWDTRELELIAKHFGYVDTFAFLAEVARRPQP